jgi:putative peptidoglycan lipid II flippase
MRKNMPAFVMQLRTRPLIWDTITTTVLSSLGKAAGFLIPFFIAAWFGVSAETDAFFFAYGLVIFLATIFSPVVETIMVPFIVDIRLKGENVGDFLGMTFGISLLGLLTLSAFFLLIIKPLLVITTKFSPEGLKLVTLILYESIPMVILIVWASILSGALNAYRIFSIPALSPALRAVITLFFIFFFKKNMGVHAIALGFVLGEFARLIILFMVTNRLNIFSIRMSFKWDSKLINFLKTSSFLILGMAVLVVIPIINKAMASFLGPGSVSLLEYADRLYMIPITLITSGFAVTTLSHWSETYEIEGVEQLKKSVYQGVKFVALIGVGLSLILSLMSSHLVNFVYGHGQIPVDKIREIENVFDEKYKIIFLFGTC